ncbi:MAG: carotenoid oxygenase family protein [Microthrixaceae bacterium]
MSIDAPDETNPYLVGHHEPVRDELDVADLAVTGRIPESLRGAYLRNGPNPEFAPLTRYHVFDGDGMVHSVHFEAGRARYRNRYVESAGLLAERRAGHALFGGLAEFRMPPPEVAETAGMMKNTANTHIVSHAGRLFALMEAAKPTELLGDLSTVGEWDYDGALHGPMTAHPKEDPDTGELLFFGYNPFPPYLRFHQVDPSGSLVRSVDIDLPAPVMMHDFAVTRRRVVFFDLPAVFDLDAMLSGGAAVSWRPDNGARIGVLDRERPEAGVTWTEVDPFFVFHFLNAHDDGDAVVVDGCRADHMTVAFGDEVLEGSPRPSLHRWRIDPRAGTVTERALDDRAADFPRVNDRFAGRPTRYGYVSHSREWDGDGIAFDGVTKHDLDAGTSVTHLYGPHALCGEAVFAPDPDRGAEDDGFLLNFVHDTDVDRSSLVIVDAPTMEEVARVHLPRRVPFGFHGSWIAG